MKVKAVIRIIAAAMLAGVAIPLLFMACGQRRGNVIQPPLTEPATGQPAENQQSINTGETGTGGVLPGVLALDALAAGVCRSVSNGTQVMSFGADYTPELSGTTSDREYSIEPSGTGLKLRAYAPGDYAYALYGQKIDGSPKPLQTLVDSEVCEFGGGQDDDIPLVYYLGFADYSVGSWRWFGPFGDVDVVVEVNSAALKSRFKSPNDNFYLCVMTTNPGRTASSLSAEGLVAPLPFEPMARVASEDELDPGGVTIETVITDTEEGLDTEPAVVTGLAAVTDAGGVTLSWDTNIDPDVFMYQVFRDDRDDEDAKVLIKGIAAPDVEYRDEDGAPGKEYEYSVRALKLGDLEGGGFAAINAARSPAAPTVTASDGAYSDQVHIEWTSVDGAVGYSVLRADTVDGAKAELASVDAETFSYNDYDVVLEQTYYYWIQPSGEDIDGPLGGPDSGFCIELKALQVTATDGDFPDRVELVWGQIEEPAPEYYDVYRDTDEEPDGKELLGSVDHPEHTFADTTAPWDEPHFYFVEPGGGGESGIGDWGHRGLGIPADVTATQGTNASKVTISWDAVNLASRYKVYRSESEMTPDPPEIAEVEAPQTSYDDAPGGWAGTEGVHYFYFVAALHEETDTERSDLSAPTEGWRGIAAPTTVTATNGTLGDRAAVSWSAVSQATVYQVYRDDSPIGDPIEAPTTTYSDYDTTFNAHHDYSVSAGIAPGYGPMSASDEGWRGLLAPANVQASDGEYTDKIAVMWGMVNTATGYRIYRSTTDDDPSPPLLTSVTGGTTTNYDDFSAVPNTQYWYSVSAWIIIQLNEGSRSADDVGTIGNKSPVASLDADPIEGDAPLTVNFDASDSYDDDGSIVKYEWDWTNDGTYDHDSGTDPTVDHEYTSGGKHTAKVRVTDDDGGTDVASVTVDIWCWKTIAVNTEGDVGKYASMALVGLNPAVSYWDYTNQDLKYVRAGDTQGANWDTPVTPDSSGDVGNNSSLLVVNGKPAIVYSGNTDLKYVRAQDGTGSSWGSPLSIDTSGTLPGLPSLALVSGYPAVAYMDWSNYDIRFIRALDQNGDSWGTSFNMADTGGYGGHPSLALVNGNPAVSYYNGELKFIRATGSDGSEWNTPVTADADDGVGQWTSLVVVGGNPAISYYDAIQKDLRYVRASDANGGSWGTRITIDSAGNVGGHTSLAIVNGNPAISYYDYTNGDLKYVRASDANGDSWGFPIAVDSQGDVGGYTSLTVLDNGNPAVSYYDATNGDLKYAYYTTEP